MSITVKQKMKARKADYMKVEIDDLVKFVEKNRHSHEIIFGPCKPYYDYDPQYGSEQKAKDQFFHDHELAYKTLANYFGKSDVLSFCAPGKTLDKKGNTMWKNSFHFRIRNWGYYESAAYIPRFPIFDQQVYCERPECQTALDKGVKSIRLPYCSKENSDRVLRRLYREEFVRGEGVPNEVKLTVLDDLSKCNNIGEPYSSWCPTYVEGEKLRKPTDKQIAEVAARIKQIDDDCGAIDADLNAGRYPRRSPEQIREIVECLGPNRSSYGERMSIVFGLSQIARSQGMAAEIRPIAHEFVERIKGNDYDQSEVNGWFDAVGDQTTFGTVIFKAKEDSPDASWSFLKVKRIRAIAPEAPTFYEDKYKLLDDEPTEADVQTWMMGCLVYIEKEERWYSRYRSGWEPVPVASKSKNLPFMTESTRSSIPVNSVVKGKTVVVEKQFCDILRALNQSAAFDGCRFIEAKWQPYFKIAPAGVFNLWEGWLHPIDDTLVSPEDPDIKRIISHLNDLCGDEKGCLYYVQYLACMIQRPTEKRPTIIFYSAKQGTGKSWWISFMIEYALGDQNVLTTPNPSVVIEHFNSMATNQILTVFEEARPVGENAKKSILTNQVFKDMQTNKRITVTGKHIDTKKGFNISCYHILTNFLAALLLEATDRRNVLYKGNCEHVGDRAYFDAMRAQLEKPEVGKKWLNYLAQMDLTGFDVWALPESEIKDQIKERSLNVVLEHIKACVEDDREIKIPAGGQAFGIKSLYADFRSYCEEIGVQKAYTKGQKAYQDEIEQSLNLKYERHYTTGDRPERIASFWFEIEDLEKRFQDAVGVKTFRFDRE